MNKKTYHLDIKDVPFFTKQFYVWKFFDVYKKQKIYQHMKTFSCVASTNGLDINDLFEYNLNKHGFRCDDFKKEPVDFLYAGCSETFGQGGPIEESWAYVLNKKVGNSGPYINLGVPGAGWTEIIANVFTYIENFGAPKNIFVLLPNMERRTVYGYGPHGVLSKIKIFRNKIIENKKDPKGYYLWWFPGMSNESNKYPRKYRLKPDNYKTLFLQRYEQVRTLIKMCNALNINIVFTANSQAELGDLHLIQKNSEDDLKSFFYLDQDDYYKNLTDGDKRKYDGHNSFGWHNFVAEKMYEHWNVIK